MPYMLISNVSDGSSTSKEFVPPFDDPSIQAKITLHLEINDKESSKIPSSFKVAPKRSWKKLPEVFGWSVGPYIIAPKLQAEIERLEPRVQKFFPLQLFTTQTFQGRTDHGVYYLILSPPHIDAIIVEETEFSKGFGTEGVLKSKNLNGDIEFSLTRTDPCAVCAREVDGHHLWQLPKGWSPGLFCSDQLWNFYKQNKMKGWDIRKSCRLAPNE